MNFKYMLHFPDNNLYATNRDYVSIDYRLVKDEHDATLVNEDDLRSLFPNLTIFNPVSCNPQTEMKGNSKTQ